MSTFLNEACQIDLSNKTFEQLLNMKKDLKDKIQILTTERIKAVKVVRDIEKDVKKADDTMKHILNEIKRHETIYDANYMIHEYIKSIESINLLNGDEILLITNKMDRTDYRKYGDYPRWIDLEKICKEVIMTKKRYPEWILMDLEKSRQTSTIPPETFYYYKFKDDFGGYLILEIK